MELLGMFALTLFTVPLAVLIAGAIVGAGTRVRRFSERRAPGQGMQCVRQV